MTGKIGIGHIQPLRHEQPSAAGKAQQGSGAFGQILQRQIEKESGIKFSAHAEQRLASRGIRLSPERMANIKQAVDKAADKGSRESLILVDSLALIVSVKNRTVVTAMDGDSRKENVFTNIDSAVII